MFKLIALVLGLAIGFGGGVYYGVHHPAEAQKLSALEEQKFLEAQLAITKATKEKLDQLINSRQTSAPPAGASGFLSGGSRVPDTTKVEMTQLRDQTDRQMRDLEQHLASMKK